MDDVIDHTNRLGIAKMPPGYKLLQLDSGHFIYERESDGRESDIHWDKWAVYRWAWQRFNAESTPAGLPPIDPPEVP